MKYFEIIKLAATGLALDVMVRNANIAGHRPRRGAAWRGGTHINLSVMTMAQQAKKIRPLQLENPSMDSENRRSF